MTCNKCKHWFAPPSPDKRRKKPLAGLCSRITRDNWDQAAFIEAPYGCNECYRNDMEGCNLKTLSTFGCKLFEGDGCEE